MINLVLVEMRRGLARRATRVLLAVAFLGIVAIGVGVFVNSDPGFADPGFRLRMLWQGGDEDGVFGATSVFLVIGALVGGATFIGGEWRWGTVTTLLTWEPRRLRVFFAKAVAAAVLTVVVTLVLQALVAASVLPAALWRGTTAGTDGEWLRGVAGVMLRASVLAAGATLVGYAFASIGRNTAAALGAAFAYVSVLEALVRGLKPAWQRWLIGENGAVFIVGHQLRDASFERSFEEAATILACYVAGLVVIAALIFQRRDVT